jgi:hypothetical protein
MPEVAKLQLDVRLVPAEGTPDPVLLDDLVRLIQQGIVTASKDLPGIDSSGEFQSPPDNSQNDLEAKVRHDVEQASRDSQSAIEKRAATAKQPDGEAGLAEESLEAARQVVAAVQRAMIRGVGVRLPEAETK